MRMDPDVIMVGEMRDMDTIEACVRAAETGPPRALDPAHAERGLHDQPPVGFFPPEAQEVIRQRLADILVATVSLRLVKDKTGEHFLPVVEVMRATTTIQACIREGRLDEIEKHIEKGRSQYQMQTLDQHLIQLVQAGPHLDRAGRAAHPLDRPGAQADLRGVIRRAPGGGTTHPRGKCYCLVCY